MAEVYMYNPLSRDPKSAARGVGRYIETLAVGLGDSIKMVADVPNKLTGTLFSPYIKLTDAPTFWLSPATKTVGTIHDIIPLKYPLHFPLGIKKIYPLLYRYYALGLYDRIVTDSNASKKDIAAYFKINTEKIIVIAPPVAHVFFEQKQGTRPKENIPSEYCLYVGDVTWNKNLLTMARAVLKARIPLVVVGKAFEQTLTNNPWQSELQLFLDKIRGEHLFTVLGHVTDSELLWLYNNALCNILVSHDEGFGYSFAESALCKTPSVLSDIAVLHEISDNAALFAPHNESDAIAQAILQFKDKNIRNRIAIQAFKKASTYTTENSVTTLKKVLMDEL